MVNLEVLREEEKLAFGSREMIFVLIYNHFPAVFWLMPISVRSP